MTQAFYSAMSGINAGQTQLSVVSNNIANLNTTAFKSSQVTFSDVYYNTTYYGSGGGTTSSLGGTNPKQIGVGVQTAAINQDLTAGSWSSTGVSTDLYIDGNGYLTLIDSDGGLCFTRDGSLSLDSNGYLVNADGLKIAGTDSLFGTKASTTPIKVPMRLSAHTIANETTDLATKDLEDLNGKNVTTGIFFADLSYVDADGFTQYINDIKIDTSNCKNLGDITTVFQNALRNAANQGGATVFDPEAISVTCDETTGGKLILTAGDNIGLSFKSTSSTNEPGSTDFLMATEFTNTGTNAGVTTFETAILDYKQVLDYSNPNGEDTQYRSIQINNDGTVECIYSNGDKLSVKTNDETGKLEFYYTTSNYTIIRGLDVIVNENLVQPENLQIQMACFTNAQGLLQDGGNTYISGVNAGTAYFGTCASSAFGTINSGGLEASNVDLAKEFSSMIIAQRSVQANSRVFSTASDIMEQLSYLGQ